MLLIRPLRVPCFHRVPAEKEQSEGFVVRGDEVSRVLLTLVEQSILAPLFGVDGVIPAVRWKRKNM